MTLPFVVCAALTSISAAVSFAFSLVAIWTATGDGHTLALYASARSLALFIVAVAAFGIGSNDWLEPVACSMIVVQLCDAAIGLTTRDRQKAIIALCNVLSLVWMVLR